MELGSGVAVAGTAIAAIIGIIKIFPNRRNSKNYVTQREFQNFRERVTDTFEEVKNDVKDIRLRMDKLHNAGRRSE